MSTASASASIQSEAGGDRRAINLKAVIVLAAGFMLFHFGTKKLHDRQVAATSDWLYSKGMAAAESGDDRLALSTLEHYLAFGGNQEEAIETVARILQDRGSDTDELNRAFTVNEGLLLKQPERDDLRLRQSRLALKIGRLSTAANHLRQLRERDSTNPEVWLLSGRTAERLGEVDLAEGYLRQALTLPGCPEAAWQSLAVLMRSKHHDHPEADRLLNEMVQVCQSPTARLIRGTRLLESGRPLQALMDVTAGLAERPGDPALNRLLLAVADSCGAAPLPVELRNRVRVRGSSGRPADEYAAEHYKTLIESRPGHADASLCLAAVLQRNGDAKAAADVLLAARRHSPSDGSVSEMLIELLLSDNRIAEAGRVLADLPSGGLSRSRTELLHGRLALAQGDSVTAAARLQLAVGLAGADEDTRRRARTLLASAQEHSGDLAGAMAAWRAVIKSDPESAAGRLGAAHALLRSGETDTAIAEYRQLTDFPGVRPFLVNLMIERNLELPESRRDWSEVRRMLSDSYAADFAEAERILLLADVLLAEGRPEAALERLRDYDDRFPGSQPVTAAVRRLATEFGTRLRAHFLHVMQTAERRTDARQAAAELIRLELIRGGAPAIRDLADRADIEFRVSPAVADPLTLAAESFAVAARSPGPAIGTSEQSLLRGLAVKLTSASAGQNPENMLGALPIVLQVITEEELSDLLRTHRTGMSSTGLALTMLTIARQKEFRPVWLPKAELSIREAISVDPGNIGLRRLLAEAAVLRDDLTFAGQVLRQLLDAGVNDPGIAGRLAWVYAMGENGSAVAERLSAAAVAADPEDRFLLEMRGLVLLRAGKAADALPILQALNKQSSTAESLVYEAVALRRMNSEADVTELLERLRRLAALTSLAPADERLLTTEIPTAPGGVISQGATVREGGQLSESG